MGNNTSRHGGYNRYPGGQVPMYQGVDLSRTASYGGTQQHRPYGNGKSHRRAYTTDMGYSSAYIPHASQQPYQQTYMQFPQAQAQYVTQVHHIPQAFPPPVQPPQMAFPQPQMHSQPVIPSMPTALGQHVNPGVVYPPHNIVIPQPQVQSQPVHFPQPVIPGQTANAPVIPPMANIPQYQQQQQQQQQQQRHPERREQPMQMPQPVVFPEPQMPQREPSPERLAPGQYGPYDPQPRFMRNPLPSPPKDIFELSPYMSMLQELRRPLDELPHRRATSVPPQAGVRPLRRTGTLDGSRREKRRRKGIFGSVGRVFNPRRYDDEELDSLDESPTGLRSMSMDSSMQGATYAGAPTLQQLPDGSTAYMYTLHPQHGQQRQQRQSTPVIPNNAPSYVPPRSTTPIPQPREIIRIERSGGLAGLLHISPHPVHFADREWPSAQHLLEGLKFLNTRPEIAEDIRHCDSTDELGQIVANARRYVRPDWEEVVLRVMDDVLYHKFIQHDNLRGMLMDTGTADLVYATLHDPFWGDGTLGQGANELGKALVRVRERLRTEGY